MRTVLLTRCVQLGIISCIPEVFRVYRSPERSDGMLARFVERVTRTLPIRMVADESIVDMRSFGILPYFKIPIHKFVLDIDSEITTPSGSVRAVRQRTGSIRLDDGRGFIHRKPGRIELSVGKTEFYTPVSPTCNAYAVETGLVVIYDGVLHSGAALGIVE